MCSSDLQILLPVEESTLRPVPAQPGEDDEDRPQERVAPSLWTIPGDALPLSVAVPWLAEQDPRSLRPSMRLLALACRLAIQMRNRGDFAPAPQPGVARIAPHWTTESQWALAALAELVPGALLTARFALPDDPVFAVTARNLLVSFMEIGRAHV